MRDVQLGGKYTKTVSLKFLQKGEQSTYPKPKLSCSCHQGQQTYTVLEPQAQSSAQTTQKLVE